MSLWKIKLPRGKKENLPTLSLGELAYITDESELYIGGLNGENINITNTQDINTHKSTLVTDTNGSHGFNVEKGTWSPMVVANSGTPTYSLNEGSYIKLGNVIYIQCNIALSSKGDLLGYLACKGLPFNPISQVAITVGKLAPVQNVNGTIYCRALTDGTIAFPLNTTGLQAEQILDNTAILLSGFYFI